MRIEQEEARANLIKTQEACPHVYPSGQATWHVIRNYPDRQPRFLCPLCQLYVEPCRWVIGAPTPEEPRGHAYIAPEHPLFRGALKALMAKGQ